MFPQIAEGWVLSVIDEMTRDSNNNSNDNTRHHTLKLSEVPLLYIFPKDSQLVCVLCPVNMMVLLSSRDRLDICISHFCGIKHGLSMYTGQCNKFCMGSGEGYSVGSPSLLRGSIYHQSPVLPPELFSCISNSYKCCLGLEWLPS